MRLQLGITQIVLGLGMNWGLVSLTNIPGFLSPSTGVSIVVVSVLFSGGLLFFMGLSNVSSGIASYMKTRKYRDRDDVKEELRQFLFAGKRKAVGERAAQMAATCDRGETNA